MREIVIENINELESHLNDYHNIAADIESEFGGPSIYFHLESIKESRGNFLSDRHIEMIYATLASWGMHRMGPPDKTKTKLTTFAIFKDSILSFQNIFNTLREFDLRTISEDNLEILLKKKLKDIFYGLKVSISDSFLVANSKTMHHIIPNLIPPIDRQYTFRFFYYDKSDFFTLNKKYRAITLPSSKVEQYAYFCQIVRCFKNILNNNHFNNLTLDKETFNTSANKVLDNIIMAYVKSSR